MPENPYQSPEIESDTPEHPASVTVGGVPGLRDRYRIEWRIIAIVVVCSIATVGFPFIVDLLRIALHAAN